MTPRYRLPWGSRPRRAPWRPVNNMAKALEKQHLTEAGAGGVRHVTIGEEEAGVRLDKFLAKQFPQVPRSRLFRVVRKGEVRVNGGRAQVDQRLELGDDVRLPPIRATAPEPTADAAGGGVRTPSPLLLAYHGRWCRPSPTPSSRRTSG